MATWSNLTTTRHKYWRGKVFDIYGGAGWLHLGNDRINGGPFGATNRFSLFIGSSPHTLLLRIYQVHVKKLAILKLAQYTKCYQ